MLIIPSFLLSSKDDCERLQRDMYNLHKWSAESGLQFNPSERKALSVTRSLTPIVMSYYIAGVVLDREEHIGNLGIRVDGKLSNQGSCK